MNLAFKSAFSYKLIYAFSIDKKSHKGLLKVGETTLNTTTSLDNLRDNCKELNNAARERIKQNATTLGIEFSLHYTTLARRTVKHRDGTIKVEAFGDKTIHDVLENSGFPRVQIGRTNAREWFRIDLDTVKQAVETVRQNLPCFIGKAKMDAPPIVFRPEQRDAIDKTIKQFKTSGRMLWNAKMRFGKTLSALQVVKEVGFNKTIILTHRPVVDEGWFEDYGKIFTPKDGFVYGSKKQTEDCLDQLIESNKKIIYFASMQDLRGSEEVGGKFDKNALAFATEWDLVIVDEAHEGTTTELGNEVIKALVKPGADCSTKFLALSGTPFNILQEYEDATIFTWDYVMEQNAKAHWDADNFGIPNPYADLPELRIYTYDLGKLLTNAAYVELEDKAFNFREFFRTWTGDPRIDRKPIPQGQRVGDFCHKADIISFLNLMTKVDTDSRYPFATPEYRNFFRHSLWMVPGVREARALSKLIKEHPVLGEHNGFKVVNVAGDGVHEDEESSDALKNVKSAIAAAGTDGYTITLSCGRLTTGVTVPEWTAVFMLAGSYATSASNYLQTVFRVQSPCNIHGMVKTTCYVFDFAPDRTLKMIAEAAALSVKPGKAKESNRRIMGAFLNFCPVISVEGTRMVEYNVDRMLQQLKKVYADRAVRSGFDDTSIYNDEMLKLDNLQVELFDRLKGIITKSKAAPKANAVSVNEQGFGNEEYEEIEKAKQTKPAERTPEQLALLVRAAEERKRKRNAISILRGISIRMPLLIYGVNVNISDEITIEQLPGLVDDSSWEEFMPDGVSKEFFREFIKFYDPDIFIAAARRIRAIAYGADEMEPLQRIKEITRLFSGFRNPDKETVLTPWRVVNMHLSDCLGGYDFFDEAHQEELQNPRFVDQGEVTAQNLCNPAARILEINSKTGLYPLYIAYSIFRTRCAEHEEMLSHEQQVLFWDETVKENIFVICKTPMAKYITQRTLSGYRDKPINAHYFDDLVGMLKHKPENFVKKITNSSYWKVKGEQEMKFDAIVGNPPYQDMDGSGGTNDAPIYQYFVEAAHKITSRYASLIIPSRWFTTGRENLVGDFRANMLNNPSLSKMFAYTNPREVFTDVEIKGGLCYYLYDKTYSGECHYTLVQDGQRSQSNRFLGEFDIFIREPQLAAIVKKVVEHIPKNEQTVSSLISTDTPFGIPTNPRTSKKTPVTVLDRKTKKYNTKLFFLENGERKWGYVDGSKITKNAADIPRHKVFVPKAGGSGNDPNVLGHPAYGEPNSVSSQTFLYAAFDSQVEAENFISYLKTKFFRILVSACKISQDAPSKAYRFVPIQDFSRSWSDADLYAKYDLTLDERIFIESMVRPMPANGDSA